MKVLFIPFYSMRSYKTGEWLLTRDGHAAQCRNIVHMMCKRHKDIEFNIIIPEFSDIYKSDSEKRKDSFFQLFDYKEYSSRVRLIGNPFYAQNAASERINFPFNFYNEILNTSEYDVVIYNNIENVKYMKKILSGTNTRIISTITHGPSINSKDDITSTGNYILRIIDGILSCSTVFYNSNSIYNNLEELSENKKFLSGYDFLVNLNENFCYASEEEMLNRYPEKEPGSVLFLSRFSDSGRTGSNDFLDYVKKSQNGYKFYITNPSNVELPSEVDDLINQGKLFILEQNSRADYKEILLRMKVVVIMYDIEKCYSTSYFEAILNGCNIVTREHSDQFYCLNEYIYSIDKFDIDVCVKLAIENDFDFEFQKKVCSQYTVESFYNKLKRELRY